MRRRIHAFLALSLLALLALPLLNMLAEPRLADQKWHKRSFLYRLDHLAPLLTRPLYELGISLDAQQVVIGRAGWLYLGDLYEATRSAHRLPPSAAEHQQIQQISQATRAWDQRLREQGVQMLRIMVAPNKESVLTEALPQWAAAARPNATDLLLSTASPQLYVDLRPALRSSQADSPEPFFYHTDTHWNLLGAGAGFRAFAQQLSPSAPELRWPPEASYRLVRTDPRGGGDLARFLRLQGQLQDREPIPQFFLEPADVQHLDFESGQLLHHGANVPVDMPTKSVLVRNPAALNSKRVLWLRDSFGGAMSPLMVQTFSEVLQLHWDRALEPATQLDSLVRQWRPDYVFITVVERAARAPAFRNAPPGGQGQ